IGAPRADAGRGLVSVIYGGSAGLTAAGDQLWSQASPGVLGSRDPGDRFGQSLTSGDFDGDGYADLAIGVSGDRTNGIPAGAVAVLHGSAAGLTARGDQLWNTGSITGGGDLRRLGYAVAAGDVNDDGYWDLVAGAPYAD